LGILPFKKPGAKEFTQKTGFRLVEKVENQWERSGKVQIKIEKKGGGIKHATTGS